MSQPPRTLTDRLTLAFATGLGVGYSPIVPGTIGSLWGLALMYGLRQAGASIPVQAEIAVALLIVGVPLCARAARLLGLEDPGPVVWDEIAAFPLVFGCGAIPVTWSTGLAGFLLFRLFDMTKPWPIPHLERAPGGWGIMLDDQLAAVFAGLLLAGLHCGLGWV